MKYCGVLFDAFGTLVSLTDRRRPYAHLARLAGNPRAGEIIMTRPLGLTAAAGALGVSLTGAELGRLELDLEAELSSLRVYPEVLSTQMELRRQGLKIGVVSNLALPYGAALRDALPIEPDQWVMSFEVGLVKPDPAIYELACARLGCAPNEAVMVGDSWRADYEGAVAAGLSALHLDRHGAAPTARTGESTIGDLSAIPTILDRLSR
jgi:HAD superfamily hydrolase (TIGR01549 family)